MKPDTENADSGALPVIDFHVHILSSYEDWTEEAHKVIRRYNPAFYENLEENITPEGFLRSMDEAGIDYAVVLPEYAPLTHGTITNEFVAGFCASSDRLIPFCNINPHLVKHPGRELARLVDSFGFRGVKLIPVYNHFYANESRLYPLYGEAQERGLPVLVHTGSSVFRGAKLKYGDPLYLDDVAVDFPDLKLLMAHGGRGFWYNRAAFLCRLHENVYIDLTGLPPSNYLKYFPELEKIADKLVFGSDWPTAPSRKDNIAAVRALPLKEKTKEKILGLTAANLLGIK
jgi:predicted TIM-barrel fold metal-dependent hydrolase